MTARRNHSILVVDDAPAALNIIQRNLESKGYRLYTASNVADAVKILERAPVNLVITDYKMPRISGLDLIRHIRENFYKTEVIMITGYASVKGAVEAVKMGAEEYLPKPFTDDELFGAVERALNKQSLRDAVMVEAAREPSAPHGIIGRSTSVRKLLAEIEKASKSTATALVLGESGTGKELVARAIHYSGSRASAPFVPVNCGAIPEKLLESELFGYVRGAFTGANESRAGFFQTADGGTILLDEINEMSPPMQVKLLRVLQDKQVCMVGARKTQKVDVRIIAATHRDLAGMVWEKSFREDLYYRINLLPLRVPPLRERPEDMKSIAVQVLDGLAKNGHPLKLDRKDWDALQAYDWPGNVRQFLNVLKRAAYLQRRVADLLQEEEKQHTAKEDSGGMLDLFCPKRREDVVPADRIYSMYVKHVLGLFEGNITQAARALNIAANTVRKYLETLVSG